MIRMYSRKYFCPRCKEKYGIMRRLYSEKNKNGERVLMCKEHGFQQYCNCSPSELEMVVEKDD